MSGPVQVRRTTDVPRGLPSALPPGETLLWEGGPEWRSIAVRALHCRKVAFYFALLTAAVLVRGIAEDLPGTAFGVVVLAIMGCLAVGLLAAFAWMVGRTTVYTITDRRVVLKIGVALGITLNLPFTKIVSAQLRTHRDGTGDIPLTLEGMTRIGFATLWPHVRPWQTRPVQPMLRAIADPAHVARLLADALLAHTEAADAAEAAEAAEAAPPAPATPVEPMLVEG